MTLFSRRAARPRPVDIALQETPARLAGLSLVLLLAAALALGGCAQRRVDAPVAKTQPDAAPAPTATPAPAPAPVVEPEPVEPQAAEGVAMAAGGEVKVALLVPLSGRHAGLGQAMVNAAQMAIFDAADDRFTLLVRDTGGTPNGAQLAMRGAIAEGAGLVLGPIFAGSTRAIANDARAAGVNVISFSNDRSVAGGGLYVMGLSPADQVDRVVAHAAQQGMTRFAVLAPSNPYGQLVLSAMNNATRVQGGQVTRTKLFDPGSSDASSEVRSLAPSAAGAQAGYDAIMLPMGGSTLLSVAPLLPYYDIDPGAVQFLGTALWDNPQLGTEPALQGGWFAAPPPNLWRNFKDRYQALYGNQPPRLATLAYDASALASVLAGRAATSGATRVFDAEGLTQPSGFSGIDGIFRFLPGGTAQRGLAVLEMQRGQFRVLSPAPRSFRDLTS